MYLNLRELEDGRFYKSSVLNGTKVLFIDPFLKSASSFNISLIGNKFRNTIILNIAFEGDIITSCDCCLENITVPIKDFFRLLLGKDTSLIEYEHDDFDDTIFLNEDDLEIDLTDYIIQGIILSIPMKRVHKKRCITLEESSEHLAYPLSNNPELEKLKKILKKES